MLSLFNEQGSIGEYIPSPGLSVLIQEDIANLERPVTIEETKLAIDSVGDLKAPGRTTLMPYFIRSAGT